MPVIEQMREMFMRIPKHRLWILLSSFLLLACVGFSQDDWQYKPGVVVPSGDLTNTFKNASGQLLTIDGQRRVSTSKLEEVSVYHAIIFYPEGAVVVGKGGGFSNSGPISTEELTWKIQGDPRAAREDVREKRLELKYHALDNTVSVGSEIFSLTGGNLFVIRLDENWLPVVTQLREHFTEQAEKGRVLQSFKSAAREDESVQRLEF